MLKEVTHESQLQALWHGTARWSWAGLLLEHGAWGHWCQLRVGWTRASSLLQLHLVSLARGGLVLGVRSPARGCTEHGSSWCCLQTSPCGFPRCSVCPAVLPEALSHQGSSTGVQKAGSVRTESQAAGWHTEEQVF